MNTYINANIKKYTLFQVLSKIQDKGKVDFDWFLVKMKSMRYKVFRNSCTCNYCLLEWSHFKLQRDINEVNHNAFHFNLYSKYWILFHKFKTRGWNSEDAYITVCDNCYNKEKEKQNLIINKTIW